MPEYFHDVDQRSVEWLKLHLGIPTASGFGNIMTTAFDSRDGDMPKTYMYRKLAERMTRNPLLGFSAHATEQGQILEAEAQSFFTLQTGLRIKLCGFVRTDDQRAGCSPDGLVGEDSGLELKCPHPETHIKYLLASKLPNDYAAQVHGNLFVTGRQRWHFMSYCRRLPAFHVVVERDEKIMAKIAAVLTKFYADFDTALHRLTAGQQ